MHLKINVYINLSSVTAHLIFAMDFTFLLILSILFLQLVMVDASLNINQSINQQLRNEFFKRMNKIKLRSFKSSERI